MKSKSNENEAVGSVKELSISELTLSGMRWKLTSSFIKLVIQFGIGIALARILMPEDFGILGMAMVIITFAKTGAGLAVEPSLILRENLSDEFISSCFTIAALTGIVGTVILVSAAPLAKLIFDDALVILVLRVISISFFFSSINLVSRGLLRRDFELKKLMIVEIISYLTGYLLFAVPMAVMGYGGWSLVAGMLVADFTMMIIQYAMTRFPIKFRFNRAELRNIASLGGSVSLTNFFHAIAKQGDYLIIGTIFSSHTLGLYSMAYKLMSLPVKNFTSIISRVLGPTYARIQEKEGRLRFTYLMAVSVATIITLPIMVLMFIYVEDIIVGLYGQKWIGVVPILKVFVLFGVLRNIQVIGGPLAKMTGNVYPELKISIVYSASVIVGAIIGSRWGINGIVWGVGAAIIIDYLLMSGLCNRITETSISVYLMAHLNGAKITLVILLANLVLKNVGFAYVDSVLVKVFGVLIINISLVLIVVYAYPNFFIKDLVKTLRDYVQADSKYFKLIPKLRENGGWR